jgi:hypothetical protein
MYVDVARWSSHPPEEQKIRVRIPPGCKVFSENTVCRNTNDNKNRRSGMVNNKCKITAANSNRSNYGKLMHSKTEATWSSKMKITFYVEGSNGIN